MSLFAELKRRNVIRVAIAYVITAWRILQVADVVLGNIEAPGWVFQVIMLLLALGLPVAILFAWAFELTPEGLKREKDVDRSASITSHTGRKLDRAIIVILVLAVGYFAVDKFVLSNVPTTAEKSIAVLPLANISNDPDQDYLGSGISLAVTNLLASIPTLTVISSDTLSVFAGQHVDIADAARKLDVTHIVSGTVRRSDDEVRVAVRLFDARENTELWSAEYERTLDNVFEMQDDISARIIGRLRLHLSDELPTSEQIDSRAYELYLRAHHLSHTIRTPEAFAEAEELLTTAVELEPGYVPAIWSLARSISNRIDGRDPVLDQSRDARVRALVARLVELAPDSSYANGWLAAFAERAGDIQAMATYRERAIEGATDTNVYLQQMIASRYLTDLGRLDEAAALIRYVVKRDPACGHCVNQLAYVLRRAGRHREAATELEQLLEWREASPAANWGTGVAWLVAGEPAKALAYFDKAIPGPGEIGRLLALHDLGRQDEFEAEFEQMIASDNSDPEVIARVYAWTGQNDLAFEYLERMIEENEPSFAVYVKTDLYEPIKSDPRWLPFLERNGASDDDLSHIKFNPPLPPEVIADIERMRASRE